MSFETFDSELYTPPAGLDPFYGDGSDGAFNTTGNITFVSTSTDLIVKNYTSITINAGHTVTVSTPCRGLMLYSQGDVDISGTITMSEKAGLGVGRIQPLVLTKVNSTGGKTIDKYYKLATVLQSVRGGAGGAGGYGGKGSTDAGAVRSTGGTGGNGRVCAGGFGGGGGGGGSFIPGGITSVTFKRGGDGGNITYADCGGGLIGASTYGNGSRVVVDNASYALNAISLKGTPGTCGNGGSGATYILSTLTGSTNLNCGSGSGGICYGGGGGGSGAHFVYTTNYGTLGSSNAGDGGYAGGFLGIISGANITINAAGILSATGGAGGIGGDSKISYTSSLALSAYAGGGGGGGGSGGGVVSLFYKNTYVNNGTITAAGGAGGAAGNAMSTSLTTTGFEAGGPGTAGSIGTILTQQIT